MNRLHFNIHFCGVNDENFAEQIMIYKPDFSLQNTFNVDDLNKLGIFNVSELIDYIKTFEMVRERFGDWEMENFGYSTTYINYKDYLLGLKEDKVVSDIFKYLDRDQFDFVHFVVGGASIHNETGYSFTVHSGEKSHVHMPHVHVSKAEIEIRYSLDTLLPIDPLVNPHRHDNRKIILPFLQKNRDYLFEMWQHNINGYYTPKIAEDGSQFYNES